MSLMIGKTSLRPEYKTDPFTNLENLHVIQMKAESQSVERELIVMSIENYIII